MIWNHKEDSFIDNDLRSPLKKILSPKSSFSHDWTQTLWQDPGCLPCACESFESFWDGVLALLRSAQDGHRGISLSQLCGTAVSRPLNAAQQFHGITVTGQGKKLMVSEHNNSSDTMQLVRDRASTSITTIWMLVAELLAFLASLTWCNCLHLSSAALWNSLLLITKVLF